MKSIPSFGYRYSPNFSYHFTGTAQGYGLSLIRKYVLGYLPYTPINTPYNILPKVFVEHNLQGRSSVEKRPSSSSGSWQGWPDIKISALSTSVRHLLLVSFPFRSRRNPRITRAVSARNGQANLFLAP